MFWYCFVFVSIEMQRTIRIDFPTCAELINLSLRLLERGAGEDSSKGREKSSKRPKIECNFRLSCNAKMHQLHDMHFYNLNLNLYLILIGESYFIHIYLEY